MTQVEVKALFPTPFMRVTGVLPTELVAACIAGIRERATRTNTYSALLQHTDMQEASAGGAYSQVCERLRPYLAQFGELLFGETLDWSIKEIWTNVLAPGGHQSIHAHSNSFISGIVYLTDSDPSARTVFHRSIGGRDFIFSNDNPNAKIGQFNGNKWIAPAGRPGDMVLYPSYLLHEVPRNEGAERMTMAFNAIPDRLDSWGYAVRFSSYRSEP